MMEKKFKHKSKIVPKDPFFGYFSSGARRRFQQKLLQKPLPLFWSKMISKTVSQGKYTYLQSGEEKSTKTIRLNNINFLNISSYDYLGLIGNEEIELASIKAIRDYGTSAGGVRLLSGSHILHEELEYRLALFKKTEAAITFTSGYMANLAIASALVEKGDQVFIDEKSHKSIIDALDMARVDYIKFRHNDFQSLESKLIEINENTRIFVIVEGIYSMDGSILNLPELIELKRKYNIFIVVDEAHSFGVLGENGRGVNEYFDIPSSEVDIWTSSLSKAIPSNGGFIAGSRELIIYLQHQASPYVFSSSLNLGSVAAIIKSLDILETSTERIDVLWNNTEYFLKKSKLLGINMGISESPITPVIIGGRTDTLNLSSYMYDNRILASAAVFPAVPFNQGRLRICMSSAFTREEIDFILETINKGLKTYAKNKIISEY